MEQYTAEEAARYAEQYRILMEIDGLARRSFEIDQSDPKLRDVVYNLLAKVFNEFERDVPREFREQEPIKSNFKKLEDLLYIVAH